MTDHGQTFSVGQYNALQIAVTRVLPGALQGFDPKELLRSVEGQQGTARLEQTLSQAFQALLVPAPPTFLGRLVESTQVVVNRKPTVEKMVELGTFDYRWDDGNINSANFPHDPRRPKKEQVKIDWFEYPNDTPSDTIVTDFAAQAHRPITCDETLSVAIGHPQLQRERPRVGLGSSWTDPGSIRLVPVLDRDDTGRYLDLDRWDDRWSSFFLFGAVAM